jgi:ATP-dependent helicase HrpB
MARLLLDPAMPDLSDDALRAGVSDWLAPAIASQGLARLGDLTRLDMQALLWGRLDGDRRALLERELPAAIALPRGRATIDYTGAVPTASARAQLFYGLDRLPALAGGRVVLAASLLSPAGRPIAVTSDLGGFWRGAWRDARRDMRGRYPRHDWPECPSA